MDLTYRLPCIVHPPALMPGHEVLSIFPSVYFFSFFFFYMKLLIRLEFILTSGGELQSTYLAHSNLLSQAVSSPLVLPPHVSAPSTCRAAPCGTRSLVHQRGNTAGRRPRPRSERAGTQQEGPAPGSLRPNALKQCRLVKPISKSFTNATEFTNCQKR